MKTIITPRNPELKSVRRRYAVMDGAFCLKSGYYFGTFASVRHYATSLVQKGDGMFDYSTGRRRLSLRLKEIK